jgi:AcrR family transcriptional regulator
VAPRKTTTRERLISTAAELFRRQGYAQTGVNQIIQGANATSGSFYHFFPAKEDLLLAVVDHVAEVFETEVFAPASERTDDPIEEISAILDLYRLNLDHRGLTFGSPMASLSAEVSENHPQVRARLAQVFAAWSGRIEELLRRAGPRLPPHIDYTALAQLIVCAMEGAVLGTRLNHSLAPFEATASQLTSYLDLLDNRTELQLAISRPAPEAQDSSQSADWRSW